MKTESGVPVFPCCSCIFTHPSKFHTSSIRNMSQALLLSELRFLFRECPGCPSSDPSRNGLCHLGRARRMWRKEHTVPSNASGPHSTTLRALEFGDAYLCKTSRGELHGS